MNEVVKTARRLQALANGGEQLFADDYVLTNEEIEESARLARQHEANHPEAKPYEAIAINRGSGDVVGILRNFRTDATALSNGIIRQRGASRERRSQASEKACGKRAGPKQSSDEPHRVAQLRGLMAASERMVRHLERRNAAMRLA